MGIDGPAEQDDVSPPSVQFAAYDRIQGEKELKVYAKHMMLYS